MYERVLAHEDPVRVVVLDHTALLSGGELAIARAIEGLGPRADVHALLATDGPLRDRLERAGASVEVLALDERTRTVRRDAVRPSRLDLRSLAASATYVARVAHRLRQVRPDVVHTNSLKAALYGGAAARLAGVPCVWHARDRIEAPYLPTGAVRLVRLAARVLPTVVVANSAATLGTLGVEGRVVPSPLDPAITSTRTASTSALRVTVLGRLAPWKGQDLAIEAFAAADLGPSATLHVVGAAMFGEDDYAAGLVDLAASRGVADRVTSRASSRTSRPSSRRPTSCSTPRCSPSRSARW